MGFRYDNFRFFPAYSIETLAENLAQEIARREDPLVPETVLITNYAQRIWLQHYLAQNNGICANIRFVSPESFLNSICENDAGAPAGGSFDRDALVWRVFKTLREIHAPASSVPESLRFSFRENREEDFILTAQTLADLFWHYQSFRTEMIVAWCRGEDIPELKDASPEFKREYERQKHLWQQLALREEEIPALRYRRFYESDTESIRAELPRRLFVFAPTALPRTHFEMLKKLSQHTEILFYYHNLSDNFWIESRNRKASLTQKNLIERGNELLTTWGKAARALAGELIENNFLGSVPNGDGSPAGDSLLHRIQADIRENIVRESGSAEFSAQDETPETLAGDKLSLRIHAAHSRMREMEILRDDIRDLCARDRTLRPRDILVMLPDIDAYAPFIRAVFEGSELPFSLADSTGPERFSGISAFLTLLRLTQGDVRLSEMLALLDAAPLARALNLNEQDVDSLKKILSASNARWGIDEAARARKIFGEQPVSDNAKALASRVAYNNSWAFGMRRCALGVMMGDDTSDTAKPLEIGASRPILPAENLPENAAELLGKFARLQEAARQLAAYYVEGQKSVAEWCRFLKCDLAEKLLEFSDEEGEEEALLADAIDSVRAAAETAGFADAEVALKTVVSMLENRSWENSRGFGMLRGRITFCRLQPLRNIPAKAIYIAGMNAGEFPRPTRKSALDLIAQWPKNLEWDRTARDEDCLLLLEAVLAAKTYLRFSYIGRNAKNNAIIPPCTPLAKFIDIATEALLPPELPAEARESASAAAQKQFCFEHSPQNTESEKLLSDTVATVAWRPPLFEAGKTLTLSAREQENFAVLKADEIAACLAEPAKFFSEKRLHLRTRWGGKLASDNDPEPEKVKAKEFFPRFRHYGFEKLSDPDIDTQNEILGALAKDFGALIKEKQASGEFPVLPVNTDTKAKEDLKFEPLNKRHNTWGKLIGEVLQAGGSAHSATKTFTLPQNANTRPGKVRVRADYELWQSADGANYCIKTFPGVYSADWEFTVNAVVNAAFIAAAHPEENFTFVAIHNDFVTRTGKSVIKIKSSERLREFAASLLQCFFDALENPPPYFAGMPLPAPEDDADSFFKNFLKAFEASKDYSRAYCDYVFGSDIAATHAESIRGVCFDFAKEIAALIPEKPKRSSSPQRCTSL
ncbi:MAG: exodeoxyribonuclease V subunit gamma [Opitutales bacterium]|nr:exodeoxyribonuclease V subunit gamma [Opitutales bacterium]